MDIKEQARLIFTESLRSLDAGDAVRREGRVQELAKRHRHIYAVALGKAAFPMAVALEEMLGSKLNSGVISAVFPNIEEKYLSAKWKQYGGGHPLPNEASLAAAQATSELLLQANRSRSPVIFLISGGGSAMIESPVDPSITLADLRECNQILVGCGASISEVNTIRRSFSLIKGGGLSALAPDSEQLSLLISDTEPGDEASIASGPTFMAPAENANETVSIINKYDLESRLPISVLNAIGQRRPRQAASVVAKHHHVLLSNQSAIDAAALAARNNGLIVETVSSLQQTNVELGCVEIEQRMSVLRSRLSDGGAACLITGGEFSCPVKGNGSGGRNAETALRMAFLLKGKDNITGTAFLSAGTDGIDGNSPAAGAVIDDDTLNRATLLGLDANSYLNNSDAYEFFRTLGDDITTGPTGTNVRDLRIMISRK